MEYSRNLPWTTRFCSYTNDLFVRPVLEIKKSIDNTITYKGVLSKDQLDLVYSILASVALAAVYFSLPTPIGGCIALGILGLEWVRPDLFSQRTWAMLQLGGCLYGIASTPRLLLLAVRVDSVLMVVFAGIRAVACGILGVENIDRLHSTIYREAIPNNYKAYPIDGGSAILASYQQVDN